MLAAFEQPDLAGASSLASALSVSSFPLHLIETVPLSFLESAKHFPALSSGQSVLSPKPIKA